MLITKGRLIWVAMALCLASIAVIPWADAILETERKERAPVIYKHRDAMAKIKVFEYGPEACGINIDNVANTPVIGFDGDWDEFRKEPADWDINVGNLIRRFGQASFLSLGSGRGASNLVVSFRPWSGLNLSKCSILL